jgi:hypothetical protein
MNLPFTLSPDDPRWENFTAQPPGNIASNVRAEPTTTSKVIDALMIGIPTRCKHIPVDKLTEAEKFYSHDVKYRWYAIMLAGRPGWIRDDVVKLLPVGVDPTPTVVLRPAPVVTSDPPQNSVDPPSLPVEAPTNREAETVVLLADGVRELSKWLALDIAAMETEVAGYQKMIDAISAKILEKQNIKSQLDAALKSLDIAA